MKKIKQFFINIRLAFAAFLLPVLIMIIALIAQGTYPFGDTQIAIIDMYHQYVPFLSELQYKLQHGGSLFYTWNGAGGSNFWCLVAYYGASPLNLLLALVPAKYIMEGVTGVLLIKIGLAGTFMFLNLVDQRKTDGISGGLSDSGLVTVGFSTLYALSSYVMGYYWCIMWIDVVALLPLCMMGLRRLIEGRGIALYTITLGLIVFSNYYISIMVCIFIFFYYSVLYFTRHEKEGIGFVRTTLKAVGCSFLGIGLAAIMLLPTYKAMQSTYYISSDMPEDARLYYDPLNIINQLLPNAHLTYRSGEPNLYCGMLIVILLVVYILCKGIKPRDKIIHGAFLVFMFFSLNVNKLDFIWHGFHFPNELPYRYSFVICFVLIGMAYKAFGYLESISLKAFYAILAVGIGYYLIAQKILSTSLDNSNIFFYVGVALLTAYTAIIAIYQNGKLGKKETAIILTAVLAAEMCCNTCTSLDLSGNSSKLTYNENLESMTELAEYTNSVGFARTETDSQITINEPARIHFKGISQFSSSINANTTALMQSIGVEGKPGKNRFNYNMTDPVTDALLNIKYLITRNSGIKDNNYKMIKQAGNSRLYENKYPLSIAYMVSQGIRTWDNNSENPFENLDDYIRAMSDNEMEGVFESLGDPEEVTSSFASAECVTNDYIEVFPEGEGNEATVNLKYTAPKKGNVYVYVETSGADSINVIRQNETENVGIENDCGSIVNIGRLEEGEEFTIEIMYEAGVAGSIDSHVCMVNQDLWDEAYERLSANMMTVTDYGDSYLKGEIDVDEEGVLVTSIPFDEGWTLKVDGKKKNHPEKTGGAWISTALSPGHHEIELTFRPPGFVMGMAISIVSVLLLIGLCIAGRIRKNLQDNPEDFDDEDEISPYAPPRDFQQDESLSTTDGMSSSGI